MRESEVLARVRLALQSLKVTLFRNNVGMLRDQRGIPVRFGLCEGSSDLIGFHEYIVQPKDVVALGDDAADHYHGTTQYITTKLRTYTNVGTTDSNGRVVVNLTDDGLSTGAALFSTVFVANAIGSDNSGDPMLAPLMILESVSGNTYTFRAIIGGTMDPLQFASSGITVYVHVTGIK